MKQKRIIESVRADMPDSEINRLKPDFETLLQKQSMQQHTRHRRLRLIYISIGVAAAMTGLGWLGISMLHEKPVVETIAEIPLVQTEQPPVGVNPPEPDLLKVERFTISGSKKARLSSRKGTRIRVPEKAFRFPDGTPCYGSVEIVFQEYHNPLEIFLSGIPMQYDSGGVSYTFESAGMFDITAFSDGKPLLLNEGKGIGIDLVSNDPGSYNIYRFDTLANKWVYISAENQANLKAVVVEVPETETIEIAVLPDEPVEDFALETGLAKRNPANFAFKVDFDENEFPELKDAKGVVFEIDDTITDKNLLRGKWDSLSLKHNLNQGYTLSLFRLKRQFSFKARPVLSSAEYEQRESAYRHLQAARTEERAVRMQSTVVQERRLDAQNSSQHVWAYTRSMTVYDLGKWNYDRPVPQPVMAKTLKAKFVDSQGNRLQAKSVFVVQRGVNILWSYNPGIQDILYSKSSDNFLWFTLPDGRYALITDEKIRIKSALIVAEIVCRKEALERIEGSI